MSLRIRRIKRRSLKYILNQQEFEKDRGKAKKSLVKDRKKA